MMPYGREDVKRKQRDQLGHRRGEDARGGGGDVSFSSCSTKTSREGQRIAKRSRYRSFAPSSWPANLARASSESFPNRSSIASSMSSRRVLRCAFSSNAFRIGDSIMALSSQQLELTC